MPADEFAAPSSAAGIKWKDLKGSLLLVKPFSVETGIKTVHGESTAIKADVIVLDGTGSGESYLDTLIFPKVLQSQVKSSIGGMVLGRLGEGQAKPGQSAPWLLAEATEGDKTAARAYLASLSDAPF